MKGISKKEIKVISRLEFDNTYFFTSGYIDKFSDNKTQRYNIIKNLIRKKRIVKLNRNKYYLIPIKARTGNWTEHPYLVADEIFEGDGYFIGGWAAANYWRLTDQIPMRSDIWTTKRQGKAEILGIKFQFHRTTNKRVEESVIEKIGEHPFRIQSKEKTKKWMTKRM